MVAAAHGALTKAGMRGNSSIGTNWQPGGWTGRGQQVPVSGVSDVSGPPLRSRRARFVNKLR